MNERAHNRGDVAGFLRTYQACFATRADGSSWPNWEMTWRHRTQYFCGLIRSGSNKSTAEIASMVDIKQGTLERFVRESAWKYENVEEHLRQTASEAAQGATSALVLDGMRIPKQGYDSVAVGRQWCGATGRRRVSRHDTTATEVSYSLPTLLSALFSSKSSRTTLLSATRYRRGDVSGTASMSSASSKRSV